jgi:hypothetical protein
MNSKVNEGRHAAECKVGLSRTIPQSEEEQKKNC